jgi:hypothetical protein
VLEWLAGAPQFFQQLAGGPVLTPKARPQIERDRFGEEWVIDFERRRLHDEERRPELAKRVEWIANTLGDGAGYDIASFNPDESPGSMRPNTVQTEPRRSG